MLCSRAGGDCTVHNSAGSNAISAERHLDERLSARLMSGEVKVRLLESRSGEGLHKSAQQAGQEQLWQDKLASQRE